MAAYNNNNNNGATAFFLISLLFAAASTPLAHGQSLTVRGLTVIGSLCCTPTGNCPGQGVAGVPVSLNCTLVGGSARVLGTGVTDANGRFNITLPALTGLILGQPFVPCVTTVQLPLSTVICPALNTTTGLLAAAVQSAGTVFTSTLGLIQNATITGFVGVRA
ncbi:hypothetical protein ACP275_10G154600 [Erythranthe tilingii]